MSVLLLSLISGVASGAVYGLIGLGLVIVYRATDVVNFAIGSMALAGAYVTVAARTGGVPLLPAVVIGALVAGGLGLVVREGAIRWLGSGELFSALVVTMGLSLIVDEGTRQLWGSDPKPFPYIISGETTIAGAPVQYQQLITVGIAAVAMVAVGVLFTRTALGTAMRAVAESADTAALLGIRPARIARVAWILGPALAFVGAALLAPLSGMTPGGLEGSLFRAFAGIFLGGLTSMYGAVIGGLVIGILDNLATSYVSASFRDTFVFSAAILVLLVRPEGLFAQRTFQRV